MAGYVFVGRRRHPAKIVTYQLLTLGVYGRVYLYKALREFDGHEALFLDRRPYIPLLILPFIGPLLVKRRIVRLLDDLVHHDPTTPRFSDDALRAKAWIPLVPIYHLSLQKILNHHWSMHTKEEELEIKRAQLVTLRRSKTAESQKEAGELEREIGVRAKELEDLKKASIALREAEGLRRRAKVRGGPGPLALVRKLSSAAASKLPRKKSGEPAAGPVGEDAGGPEPKEGEVPKKSSKKGPSREPEQSNAPPPEGDETPKTKKWTEMIPFLAKKGAGEASGLSRAERKEQRQKEKEAKKAAKEAAKEKKLAEKEAAKEAKAKEKEDAKAAKQASKEKEKKSAKDSRKPAPKKTEDKKTKTAGPKKGGGKGPAK